MTLNNKLSEKLSNINSEYIWLFNSASGFYGNVKYLFIYMNKFKKDKYHCYYLTQDKTNLEFIRKQGFEAYEFFSEEGKYLMSKAGVYVNEQIKEVYPKEIMHCKLLNLYHGVGLKKIERKADRDNLRLLVASKYIKYNNFIRNNMCFLVTSPMMEKHFKNMLDLEDSQIIRGLYPRNIVPSLINKDKEKLYNLLSTAKGKKIILYCPTFRDSDPSNFLSKSLVNLESLNKTLIMNDFILYIKLHVKINNDFLADQIRNNIYSNIRMWDKDLDVYDFFSIFYAAIVDYSSIYYDILAAGVTRFIRYIYDYSSNVNMLEYDYFSNTSGIIAYSFEELLENINKLNDAKYQQEFLKENDVILERFWGYSDDKTCDSIIKQTHEFKIQNKIYSVFYSYDIFDTLIHRDISEPSAIFLQVQEKINQNKDFISFPSIFYCAYEDIRSRAEKNEREYQLKSKNIKEIKFYKIFKRIADIYSLNQRQIRFLIKYELEAEYNSIYVDHTISDEILEHLSNNDKVVLISDMYLPVRFIKLLLKKSCSYEISKLPIYVSSEFMVQKRSGELFYEVYADNQPWCYNKWVHKGDNKVSDFNLPLSIGIDAQLYKYFNLNIFEKRLITVHHNSDIFKIANLYRSFRQNHDVSDLKSYFSYTIASGILVPYLKWVIDDAVKRKIDCLYFISRDGILLQNIANKIIAKFKYDIKTKLIYGSRAAWRLPSNIDYLDDDFFSNHGSFTGIDSKDNLLKMLHLSDSRFNKLFPELKDIDYIDSVKNKQIREFFKNSPVFKCEMLKIAERLRTNLIGYLKQEINFSENFAFVEFWARGYTQTCLGKLFNVMLKNYKTEFYYFRSILPSENLNIRYNYSDQNLSLLFIEAIFANAPITTVTGYKQIKENYIPIFKNQNFDGDLLEKINLSCSKFINDIYAVEFNDISKCLHLLSSFCIKYVNDTPTAEFICKVIGSLKYSDTIWEQPKEYAPILNKKLCDQICALNKNKQSLLKITRSLEMSLSRSSKEIKDYFKTLSDNENLKTDNNLKKSKLINKLYSDPLLYCLDSKIYILRICGYLLRMMPFLRKPIIFFIKKWMKD